MIKIGGNFSLRLGKLASRQAGRRTPSSQRRGYSYGFFAGRGLELLRISDSGVRMAGFPLKMMRFGFSASASTSAFAWVVITFKFKRTTCSSFICC